MGQDLVERGKDVREEVAMRVVLVSRLIFCEDHGPEASTRRYTEALPAAYGIHALVVPRERDRATLL